MWSASERSRNEKGSPLDRALVGGNQGGSARAKRGFKRGYCQQLGLPCSERWSGVH
jgi:hypothetical protein